MNLSLRDDRAVKHYKSKSQIIRVLSEQWFLNNMYCPACGDLTLTKCDDCTPLVDFICKECSQRYQLKSKGSSLGNKIVDSAYKNMNGAILANKAPNFFFLQYLPDELKVLNLILVPGHFIGPGHIEKRKPLPPSARRAGWIGCNILYANIPKEGRISVIRNGKIQKSSDVVSKWSDFAFISHQKVNNRGWTFDILNCINQLGKNEFSLDEIYKFEELLFAKHLSNFNIKPKIRQQLQILRDKGLLKFVKRGIYQRNWS